MLFTFSFFAIATLNEITFTNVIRTNLAIFGKKHSKFGIKLEINYLKIIKKYYKLKLIYKF